MKLEFGLERHLNVQKAELLRLNIECVSLSWAPKELVTKVSKLLEDLPKTVRTVSQKSVKCAAQTALFYEIQLE